jgi:hypothetical protein
MPEPVEIAIAAISAGAATVGAVQATAGMATGSSGVNVGRCDVHYPKEFPPQQFAHAGQSVKWDIIKFHGQGGYWDNNLAVAATGYVSNDNTAVVGRPKSEHPTVPVNRFILLSLDKSANSEDMSSGLLNCSIAPWGGSGDIAEGTAENPWVALHVHGRLDPVGPGDIEFSFKLSVNTFGQIHMENPQWTGTTVVNASITNEGDHVLVYLN